MRPYLRGRYHEERRSRFPREAADNHIRCPACDGWIDVSDLTPDNGRAVTLITLTLEGLRNLHALFVLCSGSVSTVRSRQPVTPRLLGFNPSQTFPMLVRGALICAGHCRSPLARRVGMTSWPPAGAGSPVKERLAGSGEPRPAPEFRPSLVLETSQTAGTLSEPPVLSRQFLPELIDGPGELGVSQRLG